MREHWQIVTVIRKNVSTLSTVTVNFRLTSQVEFFYREQSGYESFLISMLVFFIHGVATRESKYAGNMPRLLKDIFKQRQQSNIYFHSCF